MAPMCAQPYMAMLSVAYRTFDSSAGDPWFEPARPLTAPGVNRPPACGPAVVIPDEDGS